MHLVCITSGGSSATAAARPAPARPAPAPRRSCPNAVRAPTPFVPHAALAPRRSCATPRWRHAVRCATPRWRHAVRAPRHAGATPLLRHAAPARRRAALAPRRSCATPRLAPRRSCATPRWRHAAPAACRTLIRCTSPASRRGPGRGRQFRDRRGPSGCLMMQVRCISQKWAWLRWATVSLGDGFAGRRFRWAWGRPGGPLRPRSRR